MSQGFNTQGHTVNSMSIQSKRIGIATFLVISLILLLVTPLIVKGARFQNNAHSQSVQKIIPEVENSQSAQTKTLLVGIKHRGNPSLTSMVVEKSKIVQYDELFETSIIGGYFKDVPFPDNIQEEISIYRIQLTSEANSASMIFQLEADPNVVFAEPDHLAHLIAIPNDPLYPGQWGLDKINAPTAWDSQTGNTNIVIAIVDAGIDVDHPDLASQLWTNPGEIPGNGIDDDNNGYIDDTHGWNMVDDNADLSDNTGHGTEVAGVLGAASNNGQGVAGLCWNCQLMVLKVTQSGGVANYSDIIEAINYAADKGAEVINLSLGGSSDSVSLRLAVEEAAKTAVVVGGAGNDNQDVPFYPAAYEAVLAVAGTNASDTKVSSSNYGSWVDVTAPGEMITTTFDGGSYGLTSGTSMAAPYVSGLAGLLRSANTDWSANTTYAQIMQTATDVDSVNPGYEGLLGSGRIDAAQAITTLAEPILYYVGYEVDGVENGRPEPGNTIDLTITIANEWADATNVHATLSSSDGYVTIVNNTTSYGDIDTFDSTANQTPFQVTISDAAPYAHDLVFNLTVTADGGYVTAVPFTITTASGIEQVSGLISVNTTWTNDKQYIVTGNLLVQSGITLTVQAGTTIKIDGNHVILVEGNLQAHGTETANVLFTSNNEDAGLGDWPGIEVRNGGVIDLTYCEISDAFTAISVYDAQGTIDHCDIHHNSDGITGTGLRSITNSRIVNNGERGIIFPGPNVIIDHNEIAYNGGDGIHSTTSVGFGLVTRNLIHHNGKNSDWGFGIVGGPGTVISNTIIYNQNGVGFEDIDNVLFSNNNIWGNIRYDLDNSYAGNQVLNVQNNWWGTTDTGLIDQKIYDFLDDPFIGIVNYQPVLTEPEPAAPGYLHDLIVSPNSPIGIETATFELVFSRPMNQNSEPVLSFYLEDPWTNFNSTNSNIPGDIIWSMATDEDGEVWAGIEFNGAVQYIDGDWVAYNQTNSGLNAPTASSVAVDLDGVKWFGTPGYGVFSFDDIDWTYYSDFPGGSTWSIAVDNNNVKWFGTVGSGVASFDGTIWTVYNSSNSPLPDDIVLAVAVDHDNSKWFATRDGGIAHYDGTSWEIYNSSNSGLPTNPINTIAIDIDGSKWFGSKEGPIVHFSNGEWISYPNTSANVIAVDNQGYKWAGTENDGLLRYDGVEWETYTMPDNGNPIYTIAITDNDAKWFGTVGSGAHRLQGEEKHFITQNSEWIADDRWQATYDITSQIARGDQKIEVSGIQGTDGIEIPPYSQYGFTVDYAGEITDQTPPSQPFVLAGGISGDASSMESFWFVDETNASITGYRYALGTAPGAKDIINWTTTSETSVQLNGLGLVAGQKYWFSVQVRNAGGLWSESAYSGFIAGQPMGRVFLPMIVNP